MTNRFLKKELLRFVRVGNMDNLENIVKTVKTRKMNLSRRMYPCPVCESPSPRHNEDERRIHDIGISVPTDLLITYSKHVCLNYENHEGEGSKYFSMPLDHIAPKKSMYTNKVRATAKALIEEKHYSLKKVTEIMQEHYHVDVPLTTLHSWLNEY